MAGAGPLLGLDLSRTETWAQVPVKVLAVLLDKGWVIEGLKGIAPASGASADPGAPAGDPVGGAPAADPSGDPADPAAADPAAPSGEDPNAKPAG